MNRIQLKYLQTNQFFIYNGKAYTAAYGIDAETKQWITAIDIARGTGVYIHPNEYVLI